MRSEIAEYLDQMQHLADVDRITIAARHIDVLVYFFKAKKSPAEALQEYKRFLIRWNAITQNGKHTEATQ